MTANTSIDPAVFLNRPEFLGGLVVYATSGLGARFQPAGELLVLNRWQVPDRGVEPVGVVPVDPAGDLPFDVAAVGPGGSAEVDGLGLEQPDGGLAQGVVEGVADGADRAGDPGVEDSSAVNATDVYCDPASE